VGRQGADEAVVDEEDGAEQAGEVQKAAATLYVPLLRFAKPKPVF